MRLADSWLSTVPLADRTRQHVKNDFSVSVLNVKLAKLCQWPLSDFVPPVRAISKAAMPCPYISAENRASGCHPLLFGGPWCDIGILVKLTTSRIPRAPAPGQTWGAPAPAGPGSVRSTVPRGCRGLPPSESG
jgi:hypothetical protein